MEQEALADLPGRLGLLMQHLVGDALARRVGRLDLVQETMLRILVSDVTEARAAESPEALWAHARTMARRVVVDAARSVRLEPRRMLGLRRFEGLSAAETAARMGRSEAAVHSLFRRALGAWEAASGQGSDSAH